MRRTRKQLDEQETINNLSLRKKIIIRKTPIQSDIKRLCGPRAQNDALEATLSHSTGAALRIPHREVQSSKEININA